MGLTSLELGIAILCSATIGAGQFEWRNQGNHRSAKLEPKGKGAAGFSLMDARQTRLGFTNHLSTSRSLTNQVYLNGSGVAAGDVNGDGLPDLYFCGLDNSNELFLNRGNWTFERVTDAAGAACADQASTGAAFADIDGDGDLDLLVNGVARGTRLFLNEGTGRFKEATESFGLSSKSGATSLALADVDGDGFLDLYVVNYRSSTFRDEPDKRFRVNNANGRFELLTVDGRSVSEPDLKGRFTVDPRSGVVENGEPDVLYRNVGGRRFEALSWTSSSFEGPEGQRVQVPYDWGLSAMFHDLTGDGAPDLFVCNDFHSPDRFWINKGQGKFRLATEQAFKHTSLFSMGVDFADLDGDGRDEIFVADMLSREHERRQTQLMDRGPAAMLNSNAEGPPQFSRNTLFWNRGDGTFAEVGLLSGVAASEWSWCPAFLDVDLDGCADLLVTAGHERDAQNIDVSRAIERERQARPMPWRSQLELRRRFPKLAFPLMAFRNNGDLTFAFMQKEWGFSEAQIAQGLAVADLDLDGDLDLVVSCLNGPALVYRNDSGRNRVSVRLKGNKPNTTGVGARITVRAPGLPMQSQEVTVGGRYLSCDDTTRSFAAGEATNLTIHVRWRNGRESIVQGPPNHHYEIAEEGSQELASLKQITISALFRDVSSDLNHRHQDQPFDDFQRQPLIPHKFSTLGPGVTWFDFDGDGWEDLVVGSGRTGRLGIFRNDSGRLREISIGPLSRPGTRDRTTILGWQQGTNRSLLIGSANYEDGLTNGPAIRRLDWNTATMDDSFPGFSASSGPLAMADADGDGDLDLFLGSRVIAARYPEPVSSRFFRNENGKLVLDPKWSASFDDVGLVSSVVWSDLDGLGGPELILACEGGPIRVFTLDAGRWREFTSELGLGDHVGPWNSVATGDFDNDGFYDIIAGNWGRNTLYQEYLSRGVLVYYDASGASPFVPVVEAYRAVKGEAVLPIDNLDALSAVFPSLLQRYPTFASFSTARVNDLPGERKAAFRAIQMNTFDSMIFLNRRSRFVPRPLPLSCQVSPVFGLAIGDVDADGNEDLFVAQNFYGLKQNSRYDAGRGVLLLGDGQGAFTPLSSEISGIVVDGEGRGAAFCDFDRDGRLDLAVGQNSSRTCVFKNQAPNAGIRIVLEGPLSNPMGIGASVRLRYADGSFGPRREVHAGEGYWSQAGAAIVLGRAKPPSAIEVRSPSGATEVIAVEPAAHEVRHRLKP